MALGAMSCGTGPNPAVAAAGQPSPAAYSPAPPPSPAAAKGWTEPLQDVFARYASIPAADKADYQVLLEESDISYDRSGTCESVTHAVVRILTKEGVESWSVIDIGWQPWRAARPVIEARVRRASGTESVLQAATVVDVGSGDSGDNLRNDSKTTSAPLPNLEPGALIELRITERDREALPGAGYGRRFSLGYGGPVEKRVVRFRYPSSLRFSWKSIGATPSVKDSGTKGGMAGLELGYDRMPGFPSSEPFIPYDEAGRPVLAFGTADSWQREADAYRAVTEPLLDPAPVAAYVKKALDGVDPAADPLAAAKAVAAAVRRDVRYTGVYFGDNAIVPHAPADTLAAGYGDCKDQASLLVACLRAAGLDARLALLNAGSGLDVAQSLPGLEFFNHAIVFMPALDLWIDPTDFYALPGELPSMDRGREALVIAPGTTHTVTVPVPPIGETWYRESRTIELSESGPATHVLETAEAGGAAAQGLRAAYDDAPRKDHEEMLVRYATSNYKCDKATGSFGDPADLSVPFVVRVEAEGVAIAWTNDALAEVALKAGDVFDAFPQDLQVDDKKHPKRTHDAFLVSPKTYTLEYHVVAPSGFRLRSVPAPYTIDLGQALLTADFASSDPARLDATFTLAPRSQRWRPDEIEALRSRARDFFDSNAAVASFERVGQALIAEGRYAEALAEFRRLSALHPAEALHRIHASSALLHAGFQEAALAEAEAALALEPGSASAHRNLAYICVHDAFGVQFGPGTDRARAAREYLAAFDLDKTWYDNLFNYAIIKEMGDDGRIRTKGSDLEEAVRAYERAKDRIEASGHADRYLGDLFALGRHAEVVAANASFGNRKLGAGFALASLAVREGADSASKLAGAIFSDAAARRKALSDAASALLSAREYSLAGDLFLASARGTSGLAAMTSTAAIIKGVQRFDQPADQGPEAVYFEFLASLMSGRDFPAELCAPSIRDGNLRSLRGSPAAGQVSSLMDKLANLGFDEKPLLDMLRTYVKFQKATVGPMTLVSLSAPGLGLANLGDMVCLEEGGRTLLLSLEGVSGVAAEIQARLDAGDFDGARAWLAAAREPKKILPASRLLIDKGLADLLPAEAAKADAPPESLALAAAILGAGSDNPGLARRWLPAMLKAARAEVVQGRRERLWGIALDHAVTASDANLPALAREAAVKGAQTEAAAQARVTALLRRGFYVEAEGLAREALVSWPSSQDLELLLVHCLEMEGRFGEYVGILTARIDEGRAEAMDYNNAAWGELFLPKPDFAFIDAWGLARRFGDEDRAALHTLVCLYGAAGRYDEARAAWGKLMDGGEGGMAPSSLWVAQAFLARSFGLKEVAEASFRKAIELRAKPGDPVDSGSLAAAWMGRP
jgi:tetratricopeptide (TPR) repeat protein